MLKFDEKSEFHIMEVICLSFSVIFPFLKFINYYEHSFNLLS